MVGLEVVNRNGRKKRVAASLGREHRNCTSISRCNIFANYEFYCTHTLVLPQNYYKVAVVQCHCIWRICDFVILWARKTCQSMQWDTVWRLSPLICVCFLFIFHNVINRFFQNSNHVLNLCFYKCSILAKWPYVRLLTLLPDVKAQAVD